MRFLQVIFGGVGERSKIGYFIARECMDRFGDGRLGLACLARFRSLTKNPVPVAVLFNPPTPRVLALRTNPLFVQGSSHETRESTRE